MCENHVFFLPVNILMVRHAGFLGHKTHGSKTHYHVSLINWELNGTSISSGVDDLLVTLLFIKRYGSTI